MRRASPSRRADLAALGSRRESPDGHHGFSLAVSVGAECGAPRQTSAAGPFTSSWDVGPAVETGGMEDKQYDIAVSFAGEQRDYVERVVAACKQRGLVVFYDRDKNNDWWGGNFIRQQRTVYSSRTRFFVPFISNEYLSRPIPMDEFSSAMMTAVKQGDGYILPVLMGNTTVPVDLLHPHVHYLRAEDYSPEALADALVRKIGSARDAGQAPTPVGEVIEQALQFRMPKITPTTWSKYAELDRVFDLLSDRFRQAGQQLSEQGLVCTVRCPQDHLIIRVERSGRTIAGLDIHKGSGLGDDKITWSEGSRNLGSASSFNGWATPEYDKDRAAPVVRVSDLNGYVRGGGEGAGSYEEFFELLWGKVVTQIEQAA